MFSGGAHGWNIDLGNRKAKAIASTTLLREGLEEGCWCEVGFVHAVGS